MKYTFVDTCFQTHHLQFAYDANENVWTTGGGPVVGWVNTKMFDGRATRPSRRDGPRFVLDTNGNGKRDDYVEPDQPVDPTKDKRIAALLRRDAEPGRRLDLGSVSAFGGPPGLRVAPGPNPPPPRSRRSTTCRSLTSASAAPTSTSRASCGASMGRRPHRQLRSAQV